MDGAKAGPLVVENTYTSWDINKMEAMRYFRVDIISGEVVSFR